MDTYLKLNRAVFTAPWYTSTPAVRLFLHLLAYAPYSGERAATVETSLRRLHSALGLSLKQIRTALQLLVRHGVVRYEATPAGTRIVIADYGMWTCADARKPRRRKEEEEKGYDPSTYATLIGGHWIYQGMEVGDPPSVTDGYDDDDRPDGAAMHFKSKVYHVEWSKTDKQWKIAR